VVLFPFGACVQVDNNGNAKSTNIDGWYSIVTDEEGNRVAVQIDLKRHGAIWQDFWDGLISENRRKEKGIPYEQYRAARHSAQKWIIDTKVTIRRSTEDS
jgi:predicted amidohydrolase